MFRSLFVGALVASSLTGTAYVTAQTNAETAKEAFAVANAKAKAGDPITCKMKGNEDSELDCFPMCVCHKFAWRLEFQPQLRQEVKTTKLCEHWIQSELMDEACMVTCASVSHAVYGERTRRGSRGGGRVPGPPARVSRASCHSAPAASPHPG